MPFISAANSVPLRKWVQPLFGDGDVTSGFYRLRRMGLFLLQPDLATMLLYPTTVMNRQNIKWLTKFNHYEVAPILPGCFVSNAYNQMLAMDCVNKLPEQYLMKADKGTMAWAIEERLPLLDKEVIQFAFSIDPKLKRDKHVLRKAVEDLLPSDIVWRKKKGFGTPIAEWLNGGLKEMAVDKLRNGELLREICKKSSLDKIAGLLENGLNSNGVMALNPANVVWSLFVLEIWYDSWFGGKACEF